MVVYPDFAFLLGAICCGFVYDLILRALELRRRMVPWLIYILLGGLLHFCSVHPRVPLGLTISLLPILFFFFWGKTLRGTLLNALAAVVIHGSYFALLFFLLCICSFLRGILTDQGAFFLAPFGAVIFVSVVGYAVGIGILGFLKKRQNRSRCVDCRLIVKGKTVPVRCFVDTANFLTDPTSGRPVVIVEYPLLRRFLSELPPPMTYAFAAYFGPSARVIPYYAVSGEGKMLSAFLPDAFSVEGVPQRVLIAVSDRRLEERGRFFGIISPDLLKGEDR